VLDPEKGRFFATTFLKGAYGVSMPGQRGGGGSFRFFSSEAEIKQLLVDAGFPADGVSVRREGRGCAIVKAVLGGGSPDDPPAGSSRLTTAREAVATAQGANLSRAAVPEREDPSLAVTQALDEAAVAVGGAAAAVLSVIDEVVEEVVSEVDDTLEEVETALEAVVDEAVNRTAVTVEEVTGAVKEVATELEATAAEAAEPAAEVVSPPVSAEEELLDESSIDSYEWSD